MSRITIPVAALEMQTATLQRRLGCSLQNGFKVFLDAASRGRKMPRFFWGLIFQRDGTLFAGLNSSPCSPAR